MLEEKGPVSGPSKEGALPLMEIVLQVRGILMSLCVLLVKLCMERERDSTFH